MLNPATRMRVLLRLLAPLAVLIAVAALVGSAQAMPLLTFDGNFQAGVAPWTSAGGGVQCANYGTSSKSPRMRGNLYLDNSTLMGTGETGRFYLPADNTPSVYPLEACDLTAGHIPDTLPDDEYYGLAIYVPAGWTIPNRAFFGVNVDELHFQAIWGSPVTLQLHPDHVTLALETGGCNAVGSRLPGCQYRSNADNTSCRSNGSFTCLPGYYAIPPGAFVEGKWNEIIVHAHWAKNSTGSLQTWYRVMGSSTWTQSSNITGIPTVQWVAGSGYAPNWYTNEVEAYTAALSSPLTLWLDNVLTSSSMSAVQAAMP